MNRTTSLLVAALVAAFGSYSEAIGQPFPKNTNQSRNLRSVIVGGSGNWIGTESTATFIGGGLNNKSAGSYGTVGGGYGNSAGLSAVVGGGEYNIALGQNSFIGSGYNNIASGQFATVAGGGHNTAGVVSTISGGYQNTATNGGTIGGGQNNTAINGTVGGGRNNTASASHATVPGGVHGKATNAGSFVWSGDFTEDTCSFGDNTFTVRAEGGARFYTGNGTGTGVSLAAGSGTWSSLSDRNAKANFRKVDAADVLAKVAAMPVMTWNYRTQNEGIRHIGPTAQDFRAAFGVGESDTGITTVDADGVALAAIQGLVEELRARDKAIEELKAELRVIRERLSNLPPQ